jgi:hypothetical protein
VIADVPREKLSELVGRFGIGLSSDARRCKALLADVCGDRFRGECAVLVGVIEEGVAGELLSSSSGLPTEVLLDRLSRRLQVNRGISADLARWSVESWAVALGVVAEGSTLATFKMDGLTPLIDLAGADGTITDAELHHLILEAKTRGVSEADARAYLSNYAAAHGWQLGSAQRRSGRAQAAPQPPPPLPQPQSQPVPDRAFRWVAAGVVALVAIAVIVVVTKVKEQPRPPVPATPTAPTPDTLADREQRTYNAARGNLGALRAYVNSCTVCAFQVAARSEIAKLETADQEERAYNAARGDKSALQAYVSTCTVCAYASAARSEMSKLDQPVTPCGGNADYQVTRPIELLYRAMNQRDINLYAQQWADNATYRDMFSGGKIKTKGEKIDTRTKQFTQWELLNITMDRSPEVTSKSTDQAQIRVFYSISIKNYGGACLRRTGILEQYTVICGSSGLWQILENVDEINVSGLPDHC